VKIARLGGPTCNFFGFYARAEEESANAGDLAFSRKTGMWRGAAVGDAPFAWMRWPFLLRRFEVGEAGDRESVGTCADIAGEAEDGVETSVSASNMLRKGTTEGLSI